MLISLNWIRDYVELPSDVEPRALAERFSVTTAEVDDVHEVRSEARGLRAGRIQSARSVETGSNVREAGAQSGLHVVTVELGRGEVVRAVSNLKGLAVGQLLLFAPAGAHLASLRTINRGTMAGEAFDGLIVPAEAIGIAGATQEPIYLGAEYQSGDAIASELFDDWLIEIDNKSLTNRPDLWGHYGVAREVAAIVRRPLKAYLSVVPGGTIGGRPSPLPLSLEGRGVARTSDTPRSGPPGARDAYALRDPSLPQIPIQIADAKACPRYSAIAMSGVTAEPGPLWMQLRLGRVGMRPISGLVDLTNYIMADLGQPMHAFDATKVSRIEVDWAIEGEKFRTLDGAERTLTKTDLMIKCGGHSVALAGVMGGLETEVSESTTTLLLESANFDGAAVRRTAKRLNLRSEASARFEKSLDPQLTIPAIERFVALAKAMYPHFKLTSSLSDAFPVTGRTTSVNVNPHHVQRTLGRDVTIQEARDLLSPLGFAIAESGPEWTISIPSFRATGDIAIEADVIEELARVAGYGSIQPAAPHATVRDFAPNALRELQKRTLGHFAGVCGFHEIHGYIWYESNWLTQIGFDPGACIVLRNPAAEGMERLRTSLMPGLLAAATHNRFHFSTLAIVEAGSAFEMTGKDTRCSPPPLQRGERGGSLTASETSPYPLLGKEGDSAQSPSSLDREFRHVGLLLARRGKNVEDELLHELKCVIRSWSWNELGFEVEFKEAAAASERRPWEHPHRTAEAVISGRSAGRLSVIEQTLRRRMDEHLSAWGIAWAELRLSGLESMKRPSERLDAIPGFPVVAMDFSLVAPKSVRYAEIAGRVARFENPLLRRIQYITSFEGGSLSRDVRSHTLRTVIGHAARTLTEGDTSEFQAAFASYLKSCGYALRSG